MNKYVSFGTGVGIAIVLGGLAIVRAGDLNPPPGPVQPTMRTNQEIYDRIGALQANGCGGRWRAFYRADPGNPIPETLVAVGSGVVHAIIYQGSGPFILRDGATTGLGNAFLTARDASTSDTQYLILDIEFTNGLTVSSGSGAPVTVLYRLDQ